MWAPRRVMLECRTIDDTSDEGSFNQILTMVAIAKRVLYDGGCDLRCLSVPCPPLSYFTSLRGFEVSTVVIRKAEPKHCSSPVQRESSSFFYSATTSQSVTTTTLPATIRSCPATRSRPRARNTRTGGGTPTGNSSNTVKCCHSCCSSAAPLCVITRLYEGERRGGNANESGL